MVNDISRSLVHVLNISVVLPAVYNDHTDCLRVSHSVH